MNNHHVGGQAIRIMPDQKKMATNEKGNLIIKNIDKAVSQEDIFNLFNEVGSVHACKLETFPDGTSRGFCYIQFKEEESATLAM